MKAILKLENLIALTGGKAAFAKEADVSRPTLDKVLAGDPAITLETVRKLLKAGKGFLTPDDFMRGAKL